MRLRSAARRGWRAWRRQPRSSQPPLASGAGRDEGLEVLLRPYLPNDHARQVTAGYYVDTLMRAHPSTPIVMDLGCGAGDSVDLFRAYDRDVDWVGVDIVGSPEGRQRTREDAKYVTYDGVTLPFEAGTFDLIFSRQVLEHVRDPLAHLREVARVLRIGGSFIGSTSQLEPYHSRSYWNFTVFGFAELVAEAGLELLELRPGIDGMTLIERSYRGRPASFDRWFEDESPLNVKIDATSGKNRSVADVNLRKLTYAGHFAFHTLRPST